MKQTNHRMSRLPGLIFMSVLAAITVAPQLAVGGLALSSAETRSILARHPGLAIEVALGLGFWAVLVLWPLKSILAALMSERLVEIGNGTVSVIDRTPFSRSAWRLPINEYEGIAHNVRSSLSGLRHEAVLVHIDRRLSVTLLAAPTIGKAEIRELCQFLGLPEVPASWLYGFGGPKGGENASAGLEAVTA